MKALEAVPTMHKHPYWL